MFKEFGRIVVQEQTMQAVNAAWAKITGNDEMYVEDEKAYEDVLREGFVEYDGNEVVFYIDE